MKSREATDGCSDARALYHRLRFTLIIALSSVPLLSCVTTPTDLQRPVFPQVVRVKATTSNSALDIEDPGKIIVTHGSACGESDEPGEEKVAALEGVFALPAWADSATVFLNGWQLRYLGGDEALRNISASIVDIEMSGDTLSWLARGFLADEDSRDGYEFCYNYTVMAWNSNLVDAVADQDNENENRNHAYYDDNTTALGSLSSYVENPEFVSKRSVAILPRGFSFLWANKYSIICFDCPVDRHLLQIGYNMDHAEAFAKPGEAYDALPPIAGSDDVSRIDPAIRSWETYAILKDNDRQHDFWIYEYHSALGGNDIGVIEPPFTILPREDIGWFNTGCLEGPGTTTKDVEIRDIPFDYAVPMLTGWELAYSCDDKHVKLIGIRLKNIAYEKDPAETTGTLSYTVVSELRDDDTYSGLISRHKVSILGLNGREPADLAPHELMPEFCNQDSLGHLLVSVANNGPGDAPASTAQILFLPGGTVEVATPPISAGFIGPLEPTAIPPSCIVGEQCDFRITVDFGSDVTETNETNNSANGTCFLPQ